MRIAPKILRAAMLALLLPAGLALAQTKWDMPTAYSDGYFMTKNVRQFAGEVKQATGGKLEIEVHSAQSLIKHPEIRRAVQTGQVNIGEVIISIMANDNPLYSFETVPYLAPSYEQARKLWAAARPEVEKTLDGSGLKLLYSVPWPPQGLYSRKPINSAADLKGVKMRAYSPATSEFARLLGAIPTTIQAPEIAQAFMTGMVDAMVTSSTGGVDSQAWDFVKYYYDIQAFLPQNIVFVNKQAFAKLDPAVQAAVLDVARKAEARGWEWSRTEDEAAVKMLASKGIQVSKPSPKLVADLNEIGKTMTVDWIRKAGGQGAKIVETYRK